MFLDNPEVLRYAHEMAAKRFGEHFANSKQKMFTITDFRTFLVQYFAISILWVHFKNAEDSSGKLDQKPGELQMSFDEFKLAVATLTETHSHEKVSDEQLHADFIAMDTNKSNSLSFVEVCSYCCKFMDPNYTASELQTADAALSPVTRQMQEQRDTMELMDEIKNLANPNVSEADVALPPELQHQLSTAVREPRGGAEEGGDRAELYKPERRKSSATSARLKNLMAVDDLQQTLDREKSTAKLAEYKVETDRLMADLLGDGGD